jgi:hypothetical protein
VSIPTRLEVFHVQQGGLSFQVPLDVSVQCLGCAHRTSALRCEAFPRGIPKAIEDGSLDHTEPYDGDRGIMFAPVDPNANPDFGRSMLIEDEDEAAQPAPESTKSLPAHLALD